MNQSQMESETKILFKSDIIEFLNLPNLPKKTWDGKKSFKDGVAVVTLLSGMKAYAVSTFDIEKDAKPRITHVFSQEQFTSVDYDNILVVPDYMNTEGIENWDLDKQSIEACKDLVEEAQELEMDGVDEEKTESKENEWVFPEIHNIEEAEAWIRDYKRRNNIRGKVPTTLEGIQSFLYVAASDMRRKKRM